MYKDWRDKNVQDARECADVERAVLFAGLTAEVGRDWLDVGEEYWELDIEEVRKKYGTWGIYEAQQRRDDERQAQETSEQRTETKSETIGQELPLLRIRSPSNCLNRRRKR